MQRMSAALLERHAPLEVSSHAELQQVLQTQQRQQVRSEEAASYQPQTSEQEQVQEDAVLNDGYSRIVQERAARHAEYQADELQRLEERRRAAAEQEAAAQQAVALKEVRADP